MMRHFILLGFGLSLAGCGSDTPSTTPTSYCQQYALRVCEAVSPACLMPTADCSANRLANCAAQEQNAAAAGLGFIPANADACLGKVSAVYGKLNQGSVALQPSDLQILNGVCDQVYRGSSSANQACSADADCRSNLVCDKGYCGIASMVGQGEGCANVGEYCPPGFYCGNPTGVYVCMSKVALNGACDGSLPCLEGLSCVGGTCGTPLDIGYACTSDQDCGSEFCEPYAGKCAQDVRFANGSAACIAMGGT
jgi:hypothetical protein